MFTDMVGYTALGQKNESLSLALVEEQRKLVRPILVRHNGREVKTIGDAFLVEFTNALDAARCAYDIQRATREFNISLPDDKRFHLRIGVHLGDVVETDGDIAGDAVNVASRIEPLAENGGVCMTRPVYESVRNKIDVSLVSLGPRPLKNVDQPMEVYRMQMPWEKETSREGGRDSKRIAVLPFVSMSPDPNDEYFADGLTEELISRISLVNGLEVIARTSVMNYKKKEKNVSQIASELKVGTILEGSVRKSGNRVRVTAQLINANTEGHMWAKSYEDDLSDIFAVQSSLAENVAGALQLKLLRNEHPVLETTESLAAYVSFLRATQLLHEDTEQSLREAAALFGSALEKDPSYVRAHVGLSECRLGLALYDNHIESLEKAEAEARRALDLAPGLAEAHEAMAGVHVAKDEFEEASSEIEKAIELNPNTAEGHHHLGSIECTFGRFDEGLGHFQKALELDPLSLPTGFSMAHALRVSGRIGEALALLGRLKELHPRNPLVYDAYATLYFQIKEFDKAKQCIETGLQSSPDDWVLRIDRGCLYGYLGQRKEAEHELEGLMKLEGDAGRDFAQLYINIALGNLDKAFEALMRMADSHSWFFLIKFDPISAELTKDPRFSEFCKKVGIP